MPVWHAETEALRERGELVVLGIAQEQHRERCQLYAAWQQLDWPILWDPFNLTGAAAVPNVYALDEHGIVRAMPRGQGDELERFLAASYEPDAEPAAPWNEAGPAAPERHTVVECSLLPPATLTAAHYEALSALLGLSVSAEAGRSGDGLLRGAIDASLAAVAAYVDAHPDDAAGHFRLGVARRLRADGPAHRPEDFQAALDSWRRALEHEPNQYIWRRRIQQYGPRLDKPYPFYDWAEQAVAALIERGVEPPWSADDLTRTERAGPRRDDSGGQVGQLVEPPDPQGVLRRDDGSWLAVETAVAFDTSGNRPVARVHLAFRPEADVHWNNESDPLLVWVGDPVLPAGWISDVRLLTADSRATSAVSSETRRVDFEIQLPAGTSGTHTLACYALFYACEDAAGECVYLRRDLEIPVAVPGG